MKFSLCIPMYNEASIIAENAKKLWEYMENNFVLEDGTRDYEIIYSNDGSSDGCDKILRDLNLPGIKIVGYEKNRGKGAAVKTAMLASSGDIAMFTDADLAYGCDVIGDFVDYMKKNPDCFTRENQIAHFTTSIWTVNKERTKTLMVYHNLYDSWSWIGGHADGMEDLCAVAMKELQEDNPDKIQTEVIYCPAYNLEDAQIAAMDFSVRLFKNTIKK